MLRLSQKGKPPTLRFDTKQNLIIPKEHADIVMGHGSHGRNNNCFNCHNEQNLELLQTRDGREVKLQTARGCAAVATARLTATGKPAPMGAPAAIGTAAWPDETQDLRELPRPAQPNIPARKPAPGPHPLHPPANPETRNTECRNMGAGTSEQ